MLCVGAEAYTLQSVMPGVSGLEVASAEENPLEPLPLREYRPVDWKVVGN